MIDRCVCVYVFIIFPSLLNGPKTGELIALTGAEAALFCSDHDADTREDI